jgi:SnoaL-like domain
MTSTVSEQPADSGAERAVYRTFFSYLRLVDTLQWHRVAQECFTPDAEITCDLGTGRLVVAGYDEVNALYLASKDRYEHVHVAGQTLIEAARAPRARGISGTASGQR